MTLNAWSLSNLGCDAHHSLEEGQRASWKQPGGFEFGQRTWPARLQAAAKGSARIQAAVLGT